MPVSRPTSSHYGLYWEWFDIVYELEILDFLKYNETRSRRKEWWEIEKRIDLDFRNLCYELLELL